MLEVEVLSCTDIHSKFLEAGLKDFCSGGAGCYERGGREHKVSGDQARGRGGGGGGENSDLEMHFLQ